MNRRAVSFAAVAVVGTLAIVVGLVVANLPSHQSGDDDSAPVERGLPVRTAQADLASGARSLAELVRVSNGVVRAKAGGSIQTTDPQDARLVYTHQRFEVLRVYRGSIGPGEQITAFFTGGRVDEGASPYMLQLEGQPQFDRGAEYLLFLLGPRGDGEYFVVGGSQGRYQVVDERLLAVRGTAEAGSVQASLDGLTVAEAMRALSLQP